MKTFGSRIAVISFVSVFFVGGYFVVRAATAPEGGKSPGDKAVDVAAPKAAGAAPIATAAAQPAKEIGHPMGGVPFRQSGDKGTVLVGFEATLSPFANTMIVISLAPIFENANGVRTTGQTQGGATHWPVRVEAKPGYAVAKIVGMAGDRIDAFYVVFMRRHGDRLDSTDSYSSRWLGARTGNPLKEVGDDRNRPAIGISGRSGDDLDAIGLVFE